MSEVGPGRPSEVSCKKHRRPLPDGRSAQDACLPKRGPQPATVQEARQVRVGWTNEEDRRTHLWPGPPAPSVGAPRPPSLCALRRKIASARAPSSSVLRVVSPDGAENAGDSVFSAPVPIGGPVARVRARHAQSVHRSQPNKAPPLAWRASPRAASHGEPHRPVPEDWGCASFCKAAWHAASRMPPTYAKVPSCSSAYLIWREANGRSRRHTAAESVQPTEPCRKAAPEPMHVAPILIIARASNELLMHKQPCLAS